MNPWKGLKDLSSNMWIIFFTTLINRAGTMVLPFLALYLTQKQKESASSAGLVIAFYGIGALVTAPFVGKLSDYFGELKIMKFSLFGASLLLFVYTIINNYYLILLFTFLYAVINEAFRPANLSLISEVVSSEQRRSAYALNRLAANLGMSIGPVVGGFLAVVNFSLLFYVDGATSILAAFFLVFSKWQKTEEIEEHEGFQDVAGSETNELRIIKDKRLLYFLFALLPVPIVYLQSHASMPLFLVRNLHFSESTYGILFTVNTILIILIEVPLNNMITHWSDRKALSTGALLCGIGFGAMAFAKDIYSLIFTIVIWTFGEMIIFPASSAYMSEIAPKERRGQYMGIFQMTFSLAFAIGPWMGTMVLQYMGASTLWIGSFFLCSISAIMMLKVQSVGVESKSITR